MGRTDSRCHLCAPLDRLGEEFESPEGGSVHANHAAAFGGSVTRAQDANFVGSDGSFDGALLNLSGKTISASQTLVRGNLRVRPLAACLVLPLALADLSCGSALATTLPVTNCNDAGSGSLRAALAIAHSGDSINLTALTCSRISLVTGELKVTVNDLTLQGPGADVLTIAGSQAPYHRYSVLNHTGRGTLRIDALTVTDNHAYQQAQTNYNGYDSSRCVRSGFGTVSLDRSTVTACSGGGVFANGFSARDSTISDSNQGVTSSGTVSIIGSTISGNRSTQCTGVNFPFAGSVLISNSTISGNEAFGYAFYDYDPHYGAGCIAGHATITNSTVAFNGIGGLKIQADITVESSIFSNGGYDIVGGVVSGHNNVIRGSKAAVPPDTIRADPLLLPLADNGGPTQTHALAPGSPAIDAGNNPFGLATDQRGVPFARVVGAAPDIGSFESRPPAVYIDASFTGSWFDPAQSGHGLMLEVLPDSRLLALWFAFKPQGTEQAWFGGVGTFSGDTAVITDVALPTGGSWIPNFDPNKIVREPWGTMTFTFTDHDHGKVSFNSTLGYGSGSMNLLRLTSLAKQTALTKPIGSPGAVTADSSGNVYFSSDPNLVFKLDKEGTLTHIAGSAAAGYSGDGGPAIQAQLNFPLSYPELVNDPINYSPLVGGLAVDHNGNVYVADAYNNRVRRINTNGIIDTVVGTGGAGYTGDGGLATNATIHWPQGVAVDSTGNLYVSTVYASLRKIASDGRISTLTGDNCGPSYLGPGLCAPEQIAIDATNNIFVPDAYCRVRKVRQDGSVVTVAGADTVPSNGTAFTCGYSGDGGQATKAALASPYGVAVENGGSFYIADTGNSCIRKVSATGIISTVAGICDGSSSRAGYSGDGGPATNARLNKPHGVAVDSTGNVFAADTRNHRIRKISADGKITTVAGNGAEFATQTGSSVWAPTGSLITARYGHTATLLPNGKVLVVGGIGIADAASPYPVLGSAELYDPATGTWIATGNLGIPRGDHTATLLPNGKVLVAGGTFNKGPNDYGQVSVTELYDPAAGTWSPTGSLGVGRSSHSATLLQNGKVLVAGGWGGPGPDTLGSAELYDPATGSWSSTGNLKAARYWHSATLLQDGRVLVAAGTDSGDLEDVLSLAELYDPATGVWSSTGSLASGGVSFTATRLQNGKVLVSGGYLPATNVSTSELYDPVTGKWSAAGGLNISRFWHTATLLPSGEVLLAGGGHYSGAIPHLTFANVDGSELYDAHRGSWVSAPRLNVARDTHTATLLGDGRVLIAGGRIQDVDSPIVTLDTAELYASPVSIDASFAGSWFDPTQSGHGLMVEVLSENRFLALWFAFNPQGTGQSWFGGVGTYNGNVATISDVALPTGGSWIPNFDPTKILRKPWGTLTFTFSDCNHGRVDFSSIDGYGSGSMDLLRLTMPAGLSCP